MKIKRHDSRKKRKRRIRGKISGSAERPRLSVFRSNKHIYAQLIDDEAGETLLAFSDFDLDESGSSKELALEVGKGLAKKALKKDVKKIVFDRGGYKYHGQVKSLAEGAREGGLKF